MPLRISLMFEVSSCDRYGCGGGSEMSIGLGRSGGRSSIGAGGISAAGSGLGVGGVFDGVGSSVVEEVVFPCF